MYVTISIARARQVDREKLNLLSPINLLPAEGPILTSKVKKAEKLTLRKRYIGRA